jgi:hypothetical protein
MICPKIAEYEDGDWEAISRAFSGALVLEFGQSWLDHPEPAFRPGSVRVGWREDRFLFFTDLRDEEISTSASGRNQPLWQLGDVLELFAGVKDHPAYVEYHTAPNGKILQLLWPDAEALGTFTGIEDLSRFTVTDDRAVSLTRIVDGGWQVYGELPTSSLPGAVAPLAGQIWQISFGRYDYDMSGAPVLSSTSPITQPSYHRRHEWREIEFT